MTKKLNRGEPIVGYTDTQTVKLDLDGVPFKTVKYWALRVMEKSKLEGFIILKSSEKHYHVVFNRTVSWAENMSIVAWACLESKNEPLLKWFLLQCIKGSSTLRVSPKGNKPSPRVVCRQGKEDTEVRNFLRHRRHIKNILRQMRITRSSNFVKDRSQVHTLTNEETNSRLQVRFSHQCRCLYSSLHCFWKRMPIGGCL